MPADSALPLARPAGTRRQGEKLAYANFVIDLSTPARKFNFLPRAMFDTAAIQRGPNLASILFSRFRPTHSNVLRIANERYLLARERCPYIRHVHSTNGSAGTPESRSRHSTEKKKQHHYLTGYVISPPSHFDETTEIPRGTSSSESNGFQPGAAAHNEFRRASKEARSARKAHVVEFNLHVSEKCDQSVHSVDARSQAFP